MNKQIRWGIILQYVQLFLDIIIHLVYMHYVIRILGQSEYGLYNFSSSIISYLSLFSLGIGSAYLRFYARYKVKNDENGIAKLNGLYLILFLIMGAVALISGLLLSFNVKILFNETYTEAQLHTAKILMLFLTINIFWSFVVSVFNSYITSQEKFIWHKIVMIVKTILSPALCIVALLMGHGSIGLVVCTTIVTALIDITNIVYCLAKLKIKFKFGKIEKSLFKEIFVFSLFIAINQIVDQINWQADKVILGKILNASVVAVYAVAATINTVYLQFSTAVSHVFVPKVNMIVQKNEPNVDNQLTDLMIKVGRIQFFMIMLILTGFIFFGKYFINLWAGSDYKEAYYITLCLIVPVTIALIQNLGIEVQRAKNQHKFRSIVYLIMAILNIGISIGFCYLWGAIGVALGTTIALIVANGFIMNIYYHKVLKLDMLKFWKSILQASLAMLIPVAFGVLLTIFYSFANIYVYLLLIVVYTIIYAISVYFVGLNRKEKRYINVTISRLFKRKNKVSEVANDSNKE